MKARKRRPSHPGIILDEHYIKPLNLNLQKFAEHLGIARNTLFKIRTGNASVTPGLALCLAEAFDTTPQFWLNLQQNYDLWTEEHTKSHTHIKPIIKNGRFISARRSSLVRREALT
jgi:addiction module HigA family antidote